MPVNDDSLVAQYIRAIENPDSIGFRNGRWYAPDNPKFDSNNRGFGMDVNYNKATADLVKGRNGKYLTEDEERELRLQHIKESEKVLDKWTPQILREMPSEEKRAMAIGMLYRGDKVKNIVNNPSINDAYLFGSDEDMQKAVSNYYQSKKVSERAQRHNQFFNSNTKQNNIPVSIRKPTPYTPPKFNNEQFVPGKKYDEGGYLNNDWESLSYKDKAEMMKVAVANGITSLPEIRQAYNEFAKGGRMKWTMQDEAGYRAWRSRLPRNLRETNDVDYDMRAAYKAGMEPQWNDEDKAYHLGSRDPQSGRILKSPHHPTFLKALATDASLGYYPTTDSNGNTYTETWQGNNIYAKGGRLSNSQRAMNYLIGKGISKTGASAIVGTLQAESNLNPAIHAQMKGDNGEGIAQWTGSRKKVFWNTLEKIEPGAQKKYGSIVNVPLERQLDVVLTERPDVTRAIHHAKDVSTATDIMLRGYENGGGTVGTMASKGQMDRIYGKWNNGYNNQMKKRLGNAGSLLGIQIDPSSYQLPQDYFNNVASMINTEIPQMPLPDTMNVDPTTLYKAPTIDDTLFVAPKVDRQEIAYSPQQDRLEGLRKYNTIMGMMGESTPFGNLIGNSDEPGILSYINAIYS